MNETKFAGHRGQEPLPQKKSNPCILCETLTDFRRRRMNQKESRPFTMRGMPCGQNPTAENSSSFVCLPDVNSKVYILTVGVIARVRWIESEEKDREKEEKRAPYCGAHREKAGFNAADIEESEGGQ
uniref:Uncharacterized protein n=1 Tax=Vespula pensylvanica TaxID=30213 RepID=A0A834P710_VESPE|nr:hypothetical protein H0235_004240 [Vespula pensylvanica]